MSSRNRALAALKKTFKQKTISVEARRGDRFWISNGVWLANVHRAELHLVLPTLPISAIGVLDDLEEGRAVSFSEAGAQFDFGGVFPLLERAALQASKAVEVPLHVVFGPFVSKLLVVEDRLLYVDPEIFQNVRALVDPDDVTAEDERSLVAFWKDGEVLAAMMPAEGPVVETRDGAQRILNTRWRPETTTSAANG